jgi:hypothetical protein
MGGRRSTGMPPSGISRSGGCVGSCWHLVVERNLSRNIQRSYRDTMRLLIPFAADHHKTAVDRLVVTEVSADVVRGFLRHVEERRGGGVRTLLRSPASSVISGGSSHPRPRALFGVVIATSSDSSAVIGC